MTIIRQATIYDVAMITPLFDAYRQFYGKASDLELAQSFLTKRLIHQQSVIFIATSVTEEILGFTQLYPTFSSVSAARIYILNDLFVMPEARKAGVAKLLLLEAEKFACAAGAVSLSLSTAHSNSTAQKLYETLGWQRDDMFYQYELQIENS